MKRSCASQDVWEVKHAPRSRFRVLNESREISHDLALGQPWSSELGAINFDTTKIVDLVLHMRLHLWDLFYKSGLRHSKCVGITACSKKTILGP